MKNKYITFLVLYFTCGYSALESRIGPAVFEHNSINSTHIVSGKVMAITCMDYESLKKNPDLAIKYKALVLVVETHKGDIVPVFESQSYSQSLIEIEFVMKSPLLGNAGGLVTKFDIVPNKSFAFYLKKQESEMFMLTDIRHGVIPVDINIAEGHDNGLKKSILARVSNKNIGIDEHNEYFKYVQAAFSDDKEMVLLLQEAHKMYLEKIRDVPIF
jgi:hypothetical protein